MGSPPLARSERGAQSGRLSGEVLLFALVRRAGRGGSELGHSGTVIAGHLQQMGPSGMKPVMIAQALVEPVE